MEKRPFSVEWLAQSSRGGAQPIAATLGGTCGPVSPADAGESRLPSRAGRAAGRLVAAVMLTVAAREAVGEQLSHVWPSPAPQPERPDTPRGKVPPLTPPPVPAVAPRDREAVHRSSPGLEAEAGGGGGGAVPGRARTKFSAAQLQELERIFREQRYIGTSEKRRLAAVLNLSQSQVSADAAPRERPCPPPGPAPPQPLHPSSSWWHCRIYL